MQFANAREVVGTVVQQWRGYAEIRGELHEGLERRRKPPGQPLGTKQAVRPARILRAVGKADSGLAVNVMIARADDAIRGGKTGGREQLLLKPLGKFPVPGRPAPPGQIARNHQDLGFPIGGQFADRLHQQTERFGALRPGGGVFVVAEMQIREMEQDRHEDRRSHFTLNGITAMLASCCLKLQA